MDKNDGLERVDIKNCMFYYFDHIIEIEYLDFNNISLDEKSYKKILT